MKFVTSLLLLAISTQATRSKPLRIRIRNEAAILENGIGHVRVDFEANSKVDVTWCQEFPSNEGVPSDCVSLEGNPNYKIRKDVSLFYFSYMGSASISTTLSPFSRPPVLRIISKAGNLHLDHKVVGDDLDLNGKVKISRSKVKVPEIVQVLPSVASREKQPLLTCSIQSEQPMQVTWLMTSVQGTVPLFQFNEFGEESKTVEGQEFESKNEIKKTAEGLSTKSTLKMTSPKNNQADVITCVFSEENEDKVNTIHMSTLVE